MKHLKIKVAAIVVALSFNTAANAWGVVFDPTAVAQMVKQIAAMKQQYDALKQQVAATTGNYNITQGVNQVTQSFGGSWQDVVSKQASGAFASKQAQYDKLMSVIGSDGLQAMMNKSAGFKNNYEVTRMAMAVSDTSYAALSEHVKNLQTLGAKINTTKNIKEAQDLNNAIALEQGYISTIVARQAAVQSSLTANQSNGGVSSAQRMNAWNK